MHPIHRFYANMLAALSLPYSRKYDARFQRKVRHLVRTKPIDVSWTGSPADLRLVRIFNPRSRSSCSSTSEWYTHDLLKAAFRDLAPLGDDAAMCTYRDLISKLTDWSRSIPAIVATEIHEQEHVTKMVIYVTDWPHTSHLIFGQSQDIRKGVIGY